MKIPFTLEEWIKDRKHKVFTEDGKEFVVFNYQFDGFYPVRGHYKGNIDDIHCFNEKDLFIETEPELSEFEKELSRCLCDSNVRPEEEDYDKWAKEYAPALLDIARNEIVKSGYAIVESEHYLEEGRKNYERGKEEALKNLPKWKRADRDIISNTIEFAVPYTHDGGDHDDWVEVIVTNVIHKGESYLEISDLEKLPGFNE